MSRQGVHLVWFKRDLRTRDHEPLQRALKEASSAGGRVLLMHVHEPGLLDHPTTSTRHVEFQWACGDDVAFTLNQEHWGLTLHRLHAPVLEVLAHVQQTVGVASLHSHEETGVLWTFDRDKAVAAWCQTHGVPWHEVPQAGVQRRRTSRVGWVETWHVNMAKPWANPDLEGWRASEGTEAMVVWPDAWVLTAPPCVTHADDLTGIGPFQPGGERAGQAYLKSFLHEGRVNTYQKHISKPEWSRRSCSRLSPFLAWGAISIRQVYQALEATKQGRNHHAFGSRLRWHCHFIQKFESEHALEWRNVNRAYDALPVQHNPEWLERWKQGTTGIPLVDACMRAVRETGYLNFRMRAMLVSFLTHHMNHAWQDGVEHLARCFLDFEPGIHYSQFQMQAGVTGINTVRIYNPVKQGQEHDPTGSFVKQWVPELSGVPEGWVHAPWTAPPMEAAMGGWAMEGYPAPMLDLTDAARAARDRMWAFRKRPEVKAEGRRILARHVVPPRAQSKGRMREL